MAKTRNARNPNPIIPRRNSSNPENVKAADSDHDADDSNNDHNNNDSPEGVGNSLHYRMLNGKCQDREHVSVSHYSHFNRYVLNPIQRDGYAGDGRLAMFTLKN